MCLLGLMAQGEELQELETVQRCIDLASANA
jgi:hypothetical protein